MSKFAKIIMVASALFIPGIANATVPAGTYTGSVDVYKGVEATCAVTLTLNTSGRAKISLTGGEVCSALNFDYPHVDGYSTSVSGSVLTIQNVYVYTYTAGDCAGNISADVSTVGTVTFLDVDTVLPAVGGAPCLIVGTLNN